MDDISGGVCTARSCFPSRSAPASSLLCGIPPLFPPAQALHPFCPPSSEMCPSHHCLPLLERIPVKASTLGFFTSQPPFRAAGRALSIVSGSLCLPVHSSLHCRDSFVHIKARSKPLPIFCPHNLQAPLWTVRLQECKPMWNPQ